MKKRLVFLASIFFLLTVHPIFGQDSVNCFLKDYVPKKAVIPPYVVSAKVTDPVTATVNINTADTLSKVSPYLLGNAVAVWLGANINNPAMVKWINMLKPSVIRFPGGSWSDIYFWNGNPGDLPDSIPDGTTYNSYNRTYKKTKFYPQFGPNLSLTPAGYYDLRKKTGAQGLITINYAYARYGTSAHPVKQAAHLAAEWVRYDAGRTKFWEIGNEDSGPWEAGWLIDTAGNKDGQPPIISGTLYGEQFKVFRDSMKAAAEETGDTIYVGAIIDQFNDDQPGGNINLGNKGWNRQLFKAVGDSVDFYVWHDYYAGGNTTVRGQVTVGRSQVDKDISSMNYDISNKGGANRPIINSEWNTGGPSSAQISIANGMQAVTIFCEQAENNVGLSTRWLLANWDTDGMFYYKSPPDAGIPLWNPRPAFYYLYYLRQFLGDQMVKTSVSNTNLLAYASMFGSENIALILLNVGAADQVVSVIPQNKGVGNRFYMYTLTGGSSMPLSQSVVVNGDSGVGTVWGPNTDLQNIPAVAYPIDNSITFNSPANSVEYIIMDPGKNIITSAENQNSLTPGKFELNQNYPNPFNPATSISYRLPKSATVTIKVYDILGKEVAVLVNKEFKSAGSYEITFNASNLPSGVYFYRMQAGSYSNTKKLILLK